jgi:threonine/homoserine/homoserine lactone efflux protein
MSYVSIFFLSFFIAFSGALAPGPLLVSVVHESTKQGAKSGPLIILGHALLEIGMIICIIFGFTRFINSLFLIRTISLIGSGVLVYSGVSMLKALSSFSISLDNTDKKQKNLVATGITMSIANPYWTIWWLTIGLGLILSAQKNGFYAIIVFFLGHILADFSWYAFVSVVISKNKRFITEKVYRAITSTCAFILIGFGIYFAANSFTAATTP